jgi:hypothetical protein
VATNRRIGRRSAEQPINGSRVMVPNALAVARLVLRLVIAVFLVLLVYEPQVSHASDHQSFCSAATHHGLCLQLVPERGPVGTKVDLRGRIVSHQQLWRSQFNHPAYFTLIRDLHPRVRCELLASLPKATVSINPSNNRVHGSFIVGERGDCFQPQANDPDRYRVLPGRYGLTIGAHTTTVGHFMVTTAPTKATLPHTGIPLRSTLPISGVAIALLIVGTLLLRASRRSQNIERRSIL